MSWPEGPELGRTTPPATTLPPATLAAQRSPAPGGRRPRPSGRAYPAVVATEDHEAVSARLAATRALLVADAPEQVAAVVATLVRDLGGGLVPARLADESQVLPIDVSLGLTEPMLPFAEPVSVTSMRLSALLPEVLEDARLVLGRLLGDVRRDDEASRDGLTGLLSRRAWMRRLSTARVGDGVCLIDLDDFKSVNDVQGHDAGDQVLRCLGDLLLRSFRDLDACGRYGGDELVCLTPGMSAVLLGKRCDALRGAWERERPSAGAGVGLSVGVAPVPPGGGRAALLAADRAMYRAKQSGRNRTVLAGPDEVR